MAKMTGGQALIKQMHREGVSVIFGMPGIQMYEAMDAIYNEPGIRFITVRHEQAAGYMAYGYSRASGKTGTALVVPGPGLQNVSAAMGTAYSASTPIMVFAGPVAEGPDRQGPGRAPRDQRPDGYGAPGRQVDGPRSTYPRHPRDGQRSRLSGTDRPAPVRWRSRSLGIPSGKSKT